MLGWRRCCQGEAAGAIWQCDLAAGGLSASAPLKTQKPEPKKPTADCADYANIVLYLRYPRNPRLKPLRHGIFAPLR
jgi:hypothetical protein